jgi:plastocyanin
MRILITVFFVLLAAFVQAHEVSGKVQVTLKGDKPKTDLSSVIVYLSNPQEAIKISPTLLNKQYTMGMKNKQITPRALVIPVGVSVDFPNLDPIFHNLFSVSAPNEFDLGLYKGGASKQQKFDAPGIVRVFCNVHPQMVASIIVSDTPYFTVASRDGAFSLGDVDNGTFTLNAYSEEGQTSQKIEMNETPLKVILSIDARSFKKVIHKKKDGKDYSNDDEHY